MVEFGPKYGASGKILFPDINKQVCFVNCCFDVNPYGASLIARNKGLTRHFLKKQGIKMPTGEYFSRELDKYSMLSQENLNKVIFTYANKLQYPVVLKGADIHRGECVYYAHSEQEADRFLKEIFKKTNHLIVEKFIPYKCYRVLIFNGDVVACYSKEPFSITGDGKSSIRELVCCAKKHLKELDIVTDFLKIDKKIDAFIKESKYTWESVLVNGFKLNMVDVGNVSMGGTIVDHTQDINTELKEYCTKIMSIMNLKLAGLDIMSDNISSFPKKSYLIEINASPSLESYSKCGKYQDKKIDKLVVDIIKSMKKDA